MKVVKKKSIIKTVLNNQLNRLNQLNNNKVTNNQIQLQRRIYRRVNKFYKHLL